MEQNGKKGSHNNQVPGLDDVQVPVVAGFERAHDAVENITRKNSGEDLLEFENEITSGVEWQVTLRSIKLYFVKEEQDRTDGEYKRVADESFP